MNTAAIRPLIEKRARIKAPTPNDLAMFEAFAQTDVHEYLKTCLPDESYEASGVRVHSLGRIIDEVVPDAAPGGYLLPYGYLVLATSIGGNAIVVSQSGEVFWADHTSFSDKTISYKDRQTDEWKCIAFTESGIKEALIPLSLSFESFLLDLLNDRLEERLEILD